MPVREYECTACGHTFDRMAMTQDQFERQKFSTTCEECGEVANPLPPSTARPRFKGSGFYETDYKGR